MVVPMLLTHHVHRQILKECPVIAFHHEICLRMVGRSLKFLRTDSIAKVLHHHRHKRLTLVAEQTPWRSKYGDTLPNKIFAIVEADSSLTGTVTTSHVERSPMTTTLPYPFLLVGYVSMMSTATVWNRVAGCHWTIFAWRLVIDCFARKQARQDCIATLTPFHCGYHIGA
jgi:hypothetical protein